MTARTHATLILGLAVLAVTLLFALGAHIAELVDDYRRANDPPTLLVHYPEAIAA